MKKINNKLIIVIIIIFIPFISIYIKNIKEYTVTKNEQIKINKISNKLVIKNMNTYIYKEYDNYYEYKNIKIKNFLNDFNCNNTKNKLLCTKDNIKFNITIEDSLLEKYLKSNYKNISSKEIIKNNNIKDDLGLMSLIKSTKNNNPYLKSKYSLKETYSVQKFALDNIINFKSLDIISGKYNGYIYTINSNEKKLVLTINKKNYIFTFNNLEYFTGDLINDITCSIIIEGE